MFCNSSKVALFSLLTIGIVLNSISEVLDDMEIGNRRLTTENEILEMFYGDITFNIHRSVLNGKTR
jgi:hypothetical protein